MAPLEHMQCIENALALGLVSGTVGQLCGILAMKAEMCTLHTAYCIIVYCNIMQYPTEAFLQQVVSRIRLLFFN